MKKLTLIQISDFAIDEVDLLSDFSSQLDNISEKKIWVHNGGTFLKSLKLNPERIQAKSITNHEMIKGLMQTYVDISNDKLLQFFPSLKRIKALNLEEITYLNLMLNQSINDENFHIQNLISDLNTYSNIIIPTVLDDNQGKFVILSLEYFCCKLSEKLSNYFTIEHIKV